MVTKKVCTVLLVDVSPTMHKHLATVGDNLSRIVQNKIMYNKIDEFALVLCGADETNNDVHAEGLENAAAAGEDDYEEEYLNIAVKVPMACSTPASADCIAALPSMAGGGTPADYLDALTVASDILVRHERGGAFARRVIFVTDLRTSCEFDEEFIQGIAAGMRGAGVQLTVAIVGDDESGGGGEGESVRATVEANKDMLSHLCAILNTPGGGPSGAVVPMSQLSKVEDASKVLLVAQVKQTKPTTTFRGDLELTPWVSLKVWVYKKISEQNPPPMKRFTEEGGDAVIEVKGERTFMSFADPDQPTEVPPDMMISAWPYGPANIPIQDDVRKLMASKNDKGMKIFGFTPLETVPHWYGMEEARVLVPWPTKEVSAAAGLAASAGCSEREAGKAVAAMSALARAMERKSVAALTRAVWTQNSDKVSFGALTPHIIPEGDFLLFVPMPYSEDMYSADFKPLPVTGSVAASQLPPTAAAKLVPTDEQRAAAATLVDALDGAGPTPWKHLNPALTRTHALLHARAVNELALPLAPPARGGPEAAAALMAPPLRSFAQRALLPCDGSSGGGGGSGGGVHSVNGESGGQVPPPGGDDVPARAAAAAEGFLRACGGLPLAEAPRGSWRKRRLEEAAVAETKTETETAPPREGEQRGEKELEQDPATDLEVHQRRRVEDGVCGATGGVSGPGGSAELAAEGAATAETAAAAGGESQREVSWDAGGDAWAPMVKDEPEDDVGDPNAGPETQVLREFEVESPPPPAEDEEFFDDMD